MSTETRTTCSGIIRATPDEVWRTLAAFDQIARWAKKVDRAAYTTTATAGVGAARSVRSGPIALVETITEWAPPTRLTYSIEGLPLKVRRATNSWQLEPAEGGTRTTLTTCIDVGERFGAKVAAAIVSRVSARVGRQLLKDLTAHHHGGA